jgi:XTP/dITP diphosphohydrolase
MQLICATGNMQKFGIGQTILREYDIELVQKPLDIDEIQGEDPGPVLRDKALKAYAALQKPIVVSDDWWDIPALRGFPGAYMKSINHWFTPEDFIALMSGKTDRRIILHAQLAYTDGQEIRIFSNDLAGTIVGSPRGTYGPPVMHVAAMDYDEGRTISETYDQGLEHTVDRLQDRGDAWRQLARFLQGDTA